MRRLSRPNRRERDAGVATLLVVLMVPLLAIGGSLVLDGGRAYVARGETQNAADAGALAKGFDCARGIGATDLTQYLTPGVSVINAPACGSGTTTVTTRRTVTSTFPLIGRSWDITRTAVVKWGTVGSASVTPLVFSSCEFSQALLDGTADITLYLDDAKPQTGCSSLPGGFSQLDDANCAITVTAGGIATGDPGADIQKVIPCITNPTAPTLPHDILIALYDSSQCESTGCKGNGAYPILGFATFHLTGYWFNGNRFDGTLGNRCPDPSRGKYCIRGDFIRFVITNGTPGPSTDFGTVTVFLFS